MSTYHFSYDLSVENPDNYGPKRIDLFTQIKALRPIWVKRYSESSVIIHFDHVNNGLLDKIAQFARDNNLTYVVSEIITDRRNGPVYTSNNPDRTIIDEFELFYNGL